jgi:hypothetical protein
MQIPWMQHGFLYAPRASATAAVARMFCHASTPAMTQASAN